MAARLGRPRKLVIGEETIRWRSGYQDIYVKVGPDPWDVKRKAKLVVEARLGRPHKYSDGFIVFLDGERLNCDSENIVLVPAKFTVACSICGESTVVNRQRASQVTKSGQRYCRTCFRRYIAGRHERPKAKPRCCELCGKRLGRTALYYCLECFRTRTTGRRKIHRPTRFCEICRTPLERYAIRYCGRCYRFHSKGRR